MDFTGKLTGFDVLEAQLKALGPELAQKSLAKVARAAFEHVLEAARALAPIESGELRDSIRISVVRPGGGDSVVVVGLKIGKGPSDDRGEPAARRWHFIELGTRFMAAHPFLRPALDQNAERVLQDLKEGLAVEIERVLRKAAR